MPERPVTLAEREHEYQAAEQHAERVAAEYLDAKAGGRMTPELEAQMDEAQGDHRRAKRRWETRQRKDAQRQERRKGRV